MSVAALVLATAAALAALGALAFWWIRRQNLAVGPAGAAPTSGRPLPAGCEMGAQLMAATGTPTTERPAAGGQQGPAPKRKVNKGPSRRRFLRTSWLVGSLFGLGVFGGASIMFLWPNLRGGFGADIDVDSEEAILAFIAENREPYPYPAGRMYLVEYDPALDPEGVYSEVVTEGSRVMAIYQKCVHLGCKVPWSVGPQRFQCPCHGSNYNRWGEYILGPAPRGLDRFASRTENGRVIVNTATVVTGPSRETRVLQEA